MFIITTAICLVVHSNNGEIRPGSHRSELDENTAFSEAEIRGSFVVTPPSLSGQATLRKFRVHQVHGKQGVPPNSQSMAPHYSPE